MSNRAKPEPVLSFHLCTGPSPQPCKKVGGLFAVNGMSSDYHLSPVFWISKYNGCVYACSFHSKVVSLPPTPSPRSHTPHCSPHSLACTHKDDWKCKLTGKNNDPGGGRDNSGEQTKKPNKQIQKNDLISILSGDGAFTKRALVAMLNENPENKAELSQS